METIIDQPLGDVEGGDMLFLLKPVGKDTLMHAGTIIRKIIMIFQPLHQVIGIEHSHLARPSKPSGPMERI